jgi:predicted nucleotidyltransferase
MNAPGKSTEVSVALGAIAERYARALEDTLGENLVSVVLYGSVARGEATAGSDIDLFVVCEALPPGRFARLRLLDAAEQYLAADLTGLRAQGIEARRSVIVRTRAEAQTTVPLYLDMVEDARLLCDRGSFFAGVLARLRGRLRELGAERRQRGRVRYWILKRDFTPGEVIEL